MGFHGKVSGENLEISQPIIVPHRTDAVEIVKGQWPQRNFNAFFSSVSLPWEVLPTVPTTVIVPTVSPVVIMYVYYMQRPLFLFVRPPMWMGREMLL